QHAASAAARLAHGRGSGRPPHGAMDRGVRASSRPGARRAAPRMNGALVSVVVETITARFDSTTGSLANDLQATLDGIARGTDPRDRVEAIGVSAENVASGAVAELRQRF